ncbi:MAG: hypothetical protein ACI4OA_07370 [Selenomonadaceae bacterium]
MSKIRKYIATSLLLAATSILAVGCASGAPLTSGPHDKVALSAWVTYWDAPNGLKEYKSIDDKLVGLSAFEVYYDANGHHVVPKELESIIATSNKHKNSEATTYLTFVNDVIDKDVTKTKDTALLSTIFKNGASMDAEIASMIALAQKMKCGGIELDYENVWRDDAVAKSFLDFTYRLSTAAIKNHLKLRIVLEPSARFDAGFAKGPEYVVMLYNLKGTHSGPGPKADGPFIEKTIAKMAALPDGKKSVALSLGGCVWEDYGLFGLKKGRAKYITQKEAVALRDAMSTKEERDPESAVLHFTGKYDGKDIECWYADDETIRAWITAASRAGITNISLWRLGGNIDIDKIK